MKKSYLYSGPVSSFPLGDGTDVALHPGQPVLLPEDHPRTQRLLARGHLAEQAAPAPSASTKTKGGEA
jgi:hypothetical protein